MTPSNRRGILAYALLLAPLPAFAEQLDDGSVSLDWRAPSSCPSGSVMLARVRALVSGTPPPAEQVRARGVVIEPASVGQWQLTIETVQGARTWQRSLRAESCEALADAGALIIALILDPNLQTETKNDAGNALIDSPPPNTATVASAPKPPPTSSAPPAQPAPEPIPIDTTRALERAPTQNRGVDLHAAASAVADWGSLPGVAYGAEVAAGFSAKPIELELLAMILPEVEKVIAEAPRRGGAFTLAAAGLRGCYGVDGTTLSGRACTGFEGGRIQGTGFGATSWNDTKSSLWAAGRLGVFGRYRFVRPLALRFGAEGLLPINRPKFELNNLNLVHQPRSVGLRLQLGLELLFP